MAKKPLTRPVVATVPFQVETLAALGLAPGAKLTAIERAVAEALAARDEAQLATRTIRTQLLELLEIAEFRGYDFSAFSLAVAKDHLRTLKAADIRATRAEREAERLAGILGRRTGSDESIEDKIERATGRMMAGVEQALATAGVLPSKTRKRPAARKAAKRARR